MAIDFAKRDDGEFFVTFDEFYSLFNKFSVVFDISKEDYHRQTLVSSFTKDNCTGVKFEAHEDDDISNNVQYVLTVNRKKDRLEVKKHGQKAARETHMIVNLQQEDGRLKVTADTYDVNHSQFKQALFIGVCRVPDTMEKITSFKYFMNNRVSYECMPAWVVGANLENLESGRYIILPSLMNKVANSEKFKYFLTVTTNLNPDEFKLTGPGASLNDLISPTSSGIGATTGANREFIKTSSKLFTDKMIYTKSAIYDSTAKKGFYESAKYRAIKTNYAEEELEKQQVVTPRTVLTPRTMT